VTAIHPSHQILGLLRARIGAPRPGRRSDASSASVPQAHATAEAAATRMAQRIAAINDGDPDRRRKAVRVYLESELAGEFGAGFLTDPAFPHMLDAIQDQMAADAQMAQAVHALGDLLLAGGPR
jgi:hypothetical protein